MPNRLSAWLVRIDLPICLLLTIKWKRLSGESQNFQIFLGLSRYGNECKNYWILTNNGSCVVLVFYGLEVGASVLVRYSILELVRLRRVFFRFVTGFRGGFVFGGWSVFWGRGSVGGRSIGTRIGSGRTNEGQDDQTLKLWAQFYCNYLFDCQKCTDAI